VNLKLLILISTVSKLAFIPAPTTPPPQALLGLTNQGLAAIGDDGNQIPNVKYPDISGIVAPLKQY
jgi:hypothetical protein